MPIESQKVGLEQDVDSQASSKEQDMPTKIRARSVVAQEYHPIPLPIGNPNVNQLDMQEILLKNLLA